MRNISYTVNKIVFENCLTKTFKGKDYETMVTIHKEIVGVNPAWGVSSSILRKIENIIGATQHEKSQY